MKPAKLGFLLGFFIFCLLMAPGQNGVARLTRTICHKYKDICNMDMEPGSCYEVHFRFFYNKTSKECQSFLFTGCDGNLNNFRLKIECDIECNEKYRTVRYTMPPPTTTQPPTKVTASMMPLKYGRITGDKRRKSPLKAWRSPRKAQESRRQQKPRRDPQTRHQMQGAAKKTRNRA